MYAFFVKSIGILLLLLFVSLNSAAQPFSLTPGFYLKRGLFFDEVMGFGASLGVEYSSKPLSIFKVELRARCGYYDYDYRAYEWNMENIVMIPYSGERVAPLDYQLAAPEIGIVPKLYWYLWDEELALFLENEVSIGLMTGKFNYNGTPATTKIFTDFIWNYNIVVGVRYKPKKLSYVASVGYSSLNFRKSIRQHAPLNYQGDIPDQGAYSLINFGIQIPL
jgi:hypothetical protein